MARLGPSGCDTTGAQRSDGTRDHGVGTMEINESRQVIPGDIGGPTAGRNTITSAEVRFWHSRVVICHGGFQGSKTLVMGNGLVRNGGKWSLAEELEGVGHTLAKRVNRDQQQHPEGRRQVSEVGVYLWGYRPEMSGYKFTPGAVASPDAPQKPLVRKRACSGGAEWV